MSKKDVAFKLFDQGRNATSPDVKALGLKLKTRHTYYLEWQKLRGIVPESEILAGSKTGKVVSELDMIAEPPEEAEVEEEGGEEGEIEESEPEKPSSVKPSQGDGKRPPTMVAGQGLTFAITISVKTLMLYQFAASQVSDELTLGDFIDACVEDAYLGRGLDLGLIKTGADEQNG